MTYYQAPTDESTRLHPSTLVIACIESGAEGLLLDDGALPDDFFDLSSGTAGELVRGITLYSVRTAIVVPDVRARSDRFQDFVREANRGQAFRFFASRDEATEWLTGRSPNPVS